jgi:hypothetical protein
MGGFFSGAISDDGHKDGADVEGCVMSSFVSRGRVDVTTPIDVTLPRGINPAIDEARKLSLYRMCRFFHPGKTILTKAVPSGGDTTTSSGGNAVPGLTDRVIWGLSSGKWNHRRECPTITGYLTIFAKIKVTFSACRGGRGQLRTLRK